LNISHTLGGADSMAAVVKVPDVQFAARAYCFLHSLLDQVSNMDTWSEYTTVYVLLKVQIRPNRCTVRDVHPVFLRQEHTTTTMVTLRIAHSPPIPIASLEGTREQRSLLLARWTALYGGGGGGGLSRLPLL